MLMKHPPGCYQPSTFVRYRYTVHYNAYKMATLALQLALIALFSSVKTETNGQIITVPVELHTTVDLPCKCPICQESTTAVQWFRSSNSDAFIKDGKALASWYGGETGSSQGFGIKDDFSMIIYNLTDQHDQDLYRCIVFPAVGPAECTHDVKLGIYAKPDSSPVIEYIREASGFNVTCSISNVFPMTFPILTTKEGNGTANMNRDGTYNTNVSDWFSANEKETTVECLYSNFNFKSMSSLRIVGSDTIDQPEDEDIMEKNSTHINYKCRLLGLWMVWLILIIEVLFLIAIVYAIKSGRVILDPTLRKPIGNDTDDTDQDEHLGENSMEEEPAKSKRILSFGKESCVVMTFTIQTTIVFILLVSYLATARCLIEAGGKLEEKVPT